MDDVAWAAQYERGKVRDAMVYWKDDHGNIHPVPIVEMTDDGKRWRIEILRQRQCPSQESVK